MSSLCEKGPKESAGKQSRKSIYRECRKATGLSEVDWARLMCVGALGGEREVHKKERPEGMASSRGVSMPEALAAQLLLFLHEQGYNINEAVFNDGGVLVSIPKQ